MKRDADKAGRNTSAWSLDQFTKGRYFRAKLHEWGLLSVAESIERERGENMEWENIGITERAWNKVIHAGIKSILVFAHPTILTRIRRSVGYYRMLSMVSQKSMQNVSLPVVVYETTDKTPDGEKALQMAVHLNAVISSIVELDETVTRRELDLWRGMAAGTQAQGSWQNEKGNRFQKRFVELLYRHLMNSKQVKQRLRGGPIALVDGRTIVFGSEPDVGIYRDDGEIESAIEIKGGIDPAGILERLGAAMKSLRRGRKSNPTCATILVIDDASLTEQAVAELKENRDILTHWFSIDDLESQSSKRQELLRVLRL